MRIERYVQEESIRVAKAEGWLSRLVTWRCKRGGPDTVFVKAGRVVFIEFKSPGEKPRPDQVEEHKQLRGAGAEVYVCASVDGVKIALGISP